MGSLAGIIFFCGSAGRLPDVQEIVLEAADVAEAASRADKKRAKQSEVEICESQECESLRPRRPEIDVGASWKELQVLLADLQCSGEVGDLLDVSRELLADQLLLNELAFLRLTAANALLELAAALDEDMARMVSVTIAARSVLHGVAQRMGCVPQSLEPVPSVKQMLKMHIRFTEHLQALERLLGKRMNRSLLEFLSKYLKKVPALAEGCLLSFG